MAAAPDNGSVDKDITPLPQSPKKPIAKSNSEGNFHQAHETTIQTQTKKFTVSPVTSDQLKQEEGAPPAGATEEAEKSATATAPASLARRESEPSDQKVLTQVGNLLNCYFLVGQEPQQLVFRPKKKVVGYL